MTHQACAEAYGRLKNLKLVGEELGMKWQFVYAQLKRAGVPVTGDKARYGSVKDRLATKAELLFSHDVPTAINSNEEQFQAAIDFMVRGHSVDVKASRLHAARKETNGKTTASRWMFCINKQKDRADFFMLYAFDQDGDETVYTFLIPCEIATTSTTIAISSSLKSKWSDYLVDRDDLAEFFAALPHKNQ